jgi:hypothetical protein
MPARPDDSRPPDELAELVAARFAALGDPTRVRLLDALRHRGEMSVGELATEAGAGYANAAKHLWLLHRERILSPQGRVEGSLPDLAKSYRFWLSLEIGRAVESEGLGADLGHPRAAVDAPVGFADLGAGRTVAPSGRLGSRARREDSGMLTRAQIAEIHDRYRVTPREWLEFDNCYEGEGQAIFSSNPGTIRGPMSVVYREDGTAERFEMTVQELLAEQHPGMTADNVYFFVHGEPIPREPYSFSFGGFHNRCVDVRLEGRNFDMRAGDPIASADGPKIIFRPIRASVQFRCQAAPRYWVAPLLNFVSDFVVSTTELHRHVLRTRETAPFHPEVGEARVYHEQAYREANAVIPFACEHETAFIEPLLDYEERSAKVDAGETLVTAVMVGRVPSRFDATERDEWFPSDLLTLLGLATGRGVGVPFVELRGPSGELVRRMHEEIGSPSTRRRTRLIDEAFDRSTGALLSAFLSSEHRDAPWLRVALRHLLRAFTGDMTVEDRLGHLFRTIEGLAGGLALNRSRPLELTEATGHRVAQALGDCIARLEAASTGATQADQERIRGVTNRIKEVQANSPSFRTQLLELLVHARLADAPWLREFRFRTKISGGRTAWSSAAADYRNRIFHEGFI